MTLAHLEPIAALVAVAFFVGALAADWPLVTKEDLQRWVNRPRPARLLKGRTPERRRAVSALLICFGFSVAAILLNFGAGTQYWVAWVMGLFAMECLMLLDISQHMSETERESTSSQGVNT